MHRFVRARLATRALLVSGLLSATLATWGAAASGLGGPVQAPTATLATALQDDWLSTSLVDVRGEQSFSLRDLQGQVVLLQPMAVW
jgi:hypothetical protein